MNKIYFITFAAVMALFPVSLHAQRGNEDHKFFDKETFLIKRSAFITAELSLTPEEAAVFIPLFEELQQKKFEAGQKCRKLSKGLKTGKAPTDAAYTEVIDECLNAGIREMELEKEYYKKFKKILSPEKLFKCKNAEHRFVREFMGDPKTRDPRNKKEEDKEK
jgi:Spy/CpxP family protein refolding chaperone